MDLNGFYQMVDKRQSGFNLTSAIWVVMVIYYRTLDLNGINLVMQRHLRTS